MIGERGRGGVGGGENDGVGAGQLPLQYKQALYKSH